jgi:hypothetical protein
MEVLWQGVNFAKSRRFLVKNFYKNNNLTKIFDHITLSLKQDDFLTYFFLYHLHILLFIPQNILFITYIRILYWVGY